MSHKSHQSAARTRIVWAIAAGLALAAVVVFSRGTPSSTTSAPALSSQATPDRLVVLDPGMLEVLIHLETTDSIVGRPDYTDDWDEIASLPTMGTGLTPNYEQIVRANPDLILTQGSRGSVMTNLQKIAPTRNLPWLTVPEVVEGIRSTGALLKIGSAAEELASRLETGLTDTTSADSPQVLVLLGAPTQGAPELWYVKPHSIHGAALVAAGGLNAITTKLEGPPTISIEALLQIDPEMILILISDVSTTDVQIAEYRQFWEQFPMLRANKEDKIGFMIGTTHFSTGPGVLDFKTALAKEINALKAVTP
ncbi:MAG: ABC transporter substrate-binding protein [Myxococcota bacterium]|nr:ABC transporter substrate-binding protein [Myxococcota bacterium]